MDWLRIVLPIVLGLFCLIGAIRWYLRHAYQRASEEFADRYPGRTPLRMAPANFFGQASFGISQIRGNGSLFLTERKLVFKLLIPSRWIEIPLDAILKVEAPRSFLGRTKGRKLLAVYFRGDDGREDSAAWLVADLEGWTNDLSRIQQR